MRSYPAPFTPWWRRATASLPTSSARLFTCRSRRRRLPISATGSPTQQHGARTRALHRRQEWRSTFRARGLAWPEAPQALFHLLRPSRILHLGMQSDTLTLGAAAQRLLILGVEPRFEPQLSASCRCRAIVKCPSAEQLEDGFVVRDEVLHPDLSQTVMRLPANQTAPRAEPKQRSVLVCPEVVRLPDMRGDHAKRGAADMALGAEFVSLQHPETTEDGTGPAAELGQTVVGQVASTAGSAGTGAATVAGVARASGLRRHPGPDILRRSAALTLPGKADMPRTERLRRRFDVARCMKAGTRREVGPRRTFAGPQPWMGSRSNGRRSNRDYAAMRPMPG
jgi:hypothetical protein